VSAAVVEAVVEDSVTAEAFACPVLLRGTRDACALGCPVVSGPAVVPDFFTLPEAGWILRIGRNSAYKLAIEFEETGGRSGLPFVRLGKLKRVPRLALEKLHGGPITWPLPDDDASHAPRSKTKRSGQAPSAAASSKHPQPRPGDAPAATGSNAADPATKHVTRAALPARHPSKNECGSTRKHTAVPRARRTATADPAADQQLAFGF
jgi:hypothetical protein